MITVRPRVTDLVFQVYGRSLHPELFDIHDTRILDRGHYQAKVQITGAGHVVTFQYGGLTLTEVAATSNQPLPFRRRLLCKRVRREHSDAINCRGGVRYEVNFQLETLETDPFWNLHDELARVGQRRGLLHMFASSSRISQGPLSLILMETQRQRLLVQTFHTFPDDHAVLKSQTLIELARAVNTQGQLTPSSA